MKILPRLRLAATLLYMSTGTGPSILTHSSLTAIPSKTLAKPSDAIPSGELSAPVPSRKPIPAFSQIKTASCLLPSHQLCLAHPWAALSHSHHRPHFHPLCTAGAEEWQWREGQSRRISFPGNGLPRSVPGNLVFLLFAVIEVHRNKSPSPSCFSSPFFFFSN